MTTTATLGRPWLSALLSGAARALLDRLLGLLPSTATASLQPENPKTEPFMDITVTIDPRQAMTAILAATAYAGAKNKEGLDDFERLAACHADTGLLQAYWHEEVRRLARSLRGHLTAVAADTDALLEIDLTVPADFNTRLTDQLSDALDTHLRHSVLARWYTMLADSDRARAEQQLADDTLDGIRRMLTLRRRPTRKSL